MKIIKNVTETVRDDLASTISKRSKVSVAAACFSIYAYDELKKELEGIDELRFIFEKPLFENASSSLNAAAGNKASEISTLESNLYGTEFEVRFKNNLNQKAIARECAQWIRNKVRFKSNTAGTNIPGMLNVDGYSYTPFSEFSTVGLGKTRGNDAFYYTQRTEQTENTGAYLGIFNELWNDRNGMQDVTDEVLKRLSAAYEENSPEYIYYFVLYNVFREFLTDVSTDYLPDEAVGLKNSKIWNMLYDFQKDAVLGVINKLETYNGCLLADSVGLGKTFTALAVIKYYENKNKSVLVLCPKKLAENWNTFKEHYDNNPILEDRLNYDVLFHTDLSRDSGFSNGRDLSRIVWGSYDLVVIDESHNFRNGYGTHKATQENRYDRLMEKVIRQGVKTKVLMLSATPVNNRFVDLRNQLALAYEGNPKLLEDKLDLNRPLEEVFRNAQRAYNEWNKLDPSKRTTASLLQNMDYDFFRLLDHVTIARSRRHIEKYYDVNSVGKFPERLKPISKTPKLSELKSVISYKEIYDLLLSLYLTVYTPSSFVFESKKDNYQYLTKEKGHNLTQAGREEGIRRLMRINLLKRLESSVYAFKLTADRILENIRDTADKLEKYNPSTGPMTFVDELFAEEFDLDDQNIDFSSLGKNIKIDPGDLDRITWLSQLKKDMENLELLTEMLNDITPEHDGKLQELFSVMRDKINHPINGNNKKIIIFTAFADTAEYLFEQVGAFAKAEFSLETAMVTGAANGKTTANVKKKDMNTLLSLFSPRSKGYVPKDGENTGYIDILIATDCISEGQNLQDCDYLINYDIHWNPIRIIQRFGRIDRIGSKNDVIQLVNFWPDMNLDEYINLKGRVESRMKISVMTSTGDDNVIDDEEKGDLHYRKTQLERLKEEVVDIEDMSEGISIMDLGLDEYRMDLLSFVKNHADIATKPKGIYAVVPATEESPEGVIFVLRDIHNKKAKSNQNRLHPFYLVYIDKNGDVVSNYLASRNTLDTIRLLCRGRVEPLMSLCEKFNQETIDGKRMRVVSQLLSDALYSIIDAKEESDIDSLFSEGGTSALTSEITGLDDFELICYLVVK